MKSDQAEEVPVGEEERNWAELPRDALWVIFNKVAAVEVITSAQFVCRPWRMLSLEPEFWRCINMMNNAGRFKSPDLESIAIIALDRSGGCVEEFYAEKFGTDVFLGYLACRAPQLRCLLLTSFYIITGTILIQALRRFSQLEELEISLWSISDEEVEAISLACPKLKSLKLITTENYRNISNVWQTIDLAFPKLKNLKHLIAENYRNISNVGLSALFNNCPYLDCLHISGVKVIGIDENLKERCARIKNLRLSIIDMQNDDDYYFDHVEYIDEKDDYSEFLNSQF